jgi:DNA-binding CsgD family transcriptional regulator
MTKPFIIRYKEFWTNVQAMIFYPFQNIGPFIVAAMPALFTGHSVYTWYAETSAAWLAMLISCVVAIAMEAININVVHTSLDLFEQKQNGKGFLMAFFSVIVMALVSSVIGFSEDNLSPLIKGLAISSPWLTGIVYLAVGMAQSIHQDKQQVEFDRQDKHQQELEKREFERQLRLAELDKNHELKLAKIEAKKANFDGQNGSFLPENGQKLASANQAKKAKIATRREQVLVLTNDEKLTQTELAERLGVSVGTIKNDLRAMNGSVK